MLYSFFNTQTALCRLCFFFFFFNDTATTEIYPLSLHDALPISVDAHAPAALGPELRGLETEQAVLELRAEDRKSTRLNSSHVRISYAVFCLKKKNIHPSKPAANDAAARLRHPDLVTAALRAHAS